MKRTEQDLVTRGR